MCVGKSSCTRDFCLFIMRRQGELSDKVVRAMKQNNKVVISFQVTYDFLTK